MYKKIEESPRMTMHEASELYPDSYILMQMDDRSLFNPKGTVLFVGDNDDELFSIQVNSKIPLGLVVEGLNYQRSIDKL
ncbi:MAG: hypothetical protein FWG87_02480 [Defluviitaleaceae bacterium]|nr:hypothetical protein [Defluviitaleaceae bacterium]